jgi:hypothetical protein
MDLLMWDPSLTRSGVCTFQFFSEHHQHSLHVFISPRNKVALLYPKKVKVTLRLSVSQYILVSSPLWDLWQDIASCLKVDVLILWGSHSDERSGLSFVSYTPKLWSYFMTDSQSVSMTWCRAPLWDLQPDITFCQYVAVWNLQCCFCRVSSLKRGWVCSLQCNHSIGGPGSHIYVLKLNSKLLYDWRSVSQSVCLGIEHPCGTCNQILLVLPVGMLLSEICGLVSVGSLSDERMGLQFAVSSLNGPGHTEPVTILYCLIWDSPNPPNQQGS